MNDKIAPTLPRFSGEGYAARLQRHGFQVIGSGGGFGFPATLALARPGGDAVVKVGTYPAGDPWPLYAAWCLQHPGRFKPVVRSIRWHGKATFMTRFYVASMDRYYMPLSTFRKGEYELQTPEEHRRMKPVTPLANEVIMALTGWYRMLEDRGIDYRRWQEGSNDPRLAERLAKRFMKAGLRDLAIFIRELSAVFPSRMIDPQPHNWMFSNDGKLILIDPFSREPGDVPETVPRLLRH